MNSLSVFLALLAVVGTLAAGIGGALTGAIISGRIQEKLARQAFEQQKERDDIAHERQIAAIRRERLIKRYEHLLLAAEQYRAKVHFFSGVVRLRKPGINSQTPQGDHIVTAGSEEPAFTAVKEAAQELHSAYTLLALEDGHHPEIALCVDMERQFGTYTRKIGEGKTPTFPYEPFDVTYQELVKALQDRMRSTGGVLTTTLRERAAGSPTAADAKESG